ncbi:DciA family protein [Streptomyces seoulensis]
MTSTPSVSGADLARQALAAARANAKTRPAPGPKSRRATRTTRGTYGDPQGLGGVLQRLTAEQGWEDNLGGGNLIDQWTTIAPTELATTVQPVSYDADRGVLEVRPSSPAYATQIRLFQHQLVQHLNRQLGRPAVRAIRVLSAGHVSTDTDMPAPRPEPEEPVKTRETASAGYQAALDAALTHRPDRTPANPYIAEAIARQEVALRANRQAEDEHRDAVWEIDRLTTAHIDQAETVRRAAIARARHERVGGDTPRRLLGAA